MASAEQGARKVAVLWVEDDRSPILREWVEKELAATTRVAGQECRFWIAKQVTDPHQAVDWYREHHDDIGLVLMGAGYLAIGTFGSSLTESQVVAFILSWMMVFIFFLLDKVLFILPNWMVTPVEYLSIEYHFQNIARGVLDTRDIVYYLSLIILALLMAARSLAARRWR